ncbi:MAG: hypothetical protein PHS60_08420 [Zavarzinia sp.]|nr:hypothetical protein [Zavarzinia sp.]
MLPYSSEFAFSYRLTLAPPEVVGPGPGGMLMDALIRSVVIAVISGLGSTALGFFAASDLARFQPPLAGIWRFLLLMPLIVAPMCVGIGLLILANGLVLPKSLALVTLGHVAVNLASRLHHLPRPDGESPGSAGAGGARPRRQRLRHNPSRCNLGNDAGRHQSEDQCRRDDRLHSIARPCAGRRDHSVREAQTS